MNEDKLMALVHQAVGDFGAILSGALVVLGDRLGLYRHLADAGRPLTSAELAATRAVDRLTVLFRTGEGLGWPAPSPSRSSPGSATTPPRSTQLARLPRRPASTAGSASRWRPPRNTRARDTASSLSSTACMTWETRQARPGTSWALWPRMAPG